MSERFDGGREAVAPSEADEAYLRLVRRCPLRPIRSEAELDRAIATINWLIDRGAAGLRTTSEEDYLDVLGDLIEAYEDIHHQMPADLEAQPAPPPATE